MDPGLIGALNQEYSPLRTSERPTARRCLEYQPVTRSLMKGNTDGAVPIRTGG